MRGVIIYIARIGSSEPHGAARFDKIFMKTPTMHAAIGTQYGIFENISIPEIAFTLL
jgi:hypothetical protein